MSRGENLHPNGCSWATSPCERCYCWNGLLDCVTADRFLTPLSRLCVDFVTRPGECCPVCINYVVRHIKCKRRWKKNQLKYM